MTALVPPREPDVPRADASVPVPASSSWAESTIAEVDGKTTEVPRAALLPADDKAATDGRFIAPPSTDAPRTLSMGAWRPEPPSLPADEAAARPAAPSTKTTTHVAVATSEFESPTLPTLRRPDRVGVGERSHARSGGLLADAAAASVPPSRLTTSPTIRVALNDGIPATGDDPFTARATLVSSVDTSSLVRSAAHDHAPTADGVGERRHDGKGGDDGHGDDGHGDDGTGDDDGGAGGGGGS